MLFALLCCALLGTTELRAVGYWLLRSCARVYRGYIKWLLWLDLREVFVFKNNCDNLRKREMAKHFCCCQKHVC